MSRSTIMFGVGLAMAVGAAAGILWNSIDTTPFMVVGIIGVVFVAVGARDRRTHEPLRASTMHLHVDGTRIHCRIRALPHAEEEPEDIS